YGIFLMSMSANMKDILSHPDFKRLEDFSFSEKLYLAHILKDKLKASIPEEKYIEKCHEVAMILYERFKEAGIHTRNILLQWFSFFIQGLGEKVPMENPNALAAAMEYIWYKQSHNKKTQKNIAEEYGISQATLRKYIKVVEKVWQ